MIPCYAGISNIHLNYNAELWPCCVLGYAHPLGNFRDKEVNYDFKKVMKTNQANETLRYIREKQCYCPLANQSYSNIIFNVPSLGKTVYNILKFKIK